MKNTGLLAMIIFALLGFVLGLMGMGRLVLLAIPAIFIILIVFIGIATLVKKIRMKACCKDVTNHVIELTNETVDGKEYSGTAKRCKICNDILSFDLN